LTSSSPTDYSTPAVHSKGGHRDQDRRNTTLTWKQTHGTIHIIQVLLVGYNIGSGGIDSSNCGKIVYRLLYRSGHWPNEC
jgi:hypothetical protein